MFSKQYRDFIHVKDVVLANINAMNTPNISGEVFCVGTSNKVSINDLFSFMNKKYNKNFKAKYMDDRAGDILESICDNSKIKNLFNMNEFRKFEEEIIVS